MFKLVIQDDEGKTTVVPLIRDEITIGRKEGNTIRLTERNVSRRHARILRNNGEVHIEDLGSYNGIRVNNARIAERVSLRVSDQVQIGDYKLYLKAEGLEQVDEARTMPVERQQSDVPTTEAMPTVTPAVTAPQPIQSPGAPQLIGNPNRTMVALGDTDPAARALSAAVAAASAQGASAASSYGRLCVLSSNFAGKEIELSRAQMVIGRTEDNDIVINHRSISRNHAKLTRDPDNGRYTISDLQSSNGVRVNGQDYGKVELRRGDVIDLGHVRLRFVEAGEDFVFARDAVITDVPDAGSRRGVMFAVLAVLVLLGAGVAIYTTMRNSSGGGSGTTGSGDVASPGLGSTAGVGSSIDAAPLAIDEPSNPATQVGSQGSSEATHTVPPTTVPAGSGDQDKINECVKAQDSRDWQALADCARRLEAAGGHDKAKQYNDTAVREQKNALAADEVQQALRDRSLKDASTALAKISTDSVYFVSMRDAFTKSETLAAETARKNAQSFATAHDCASLRTLYRQLVGSSTPKVAAAVAPVKCVDKADVVATPHPTNPTNPPVGSGATQVTPPAKPSCDNVDELYTQAQNQYKADAFPTALALMVKVLDCKPTPRNFQFAALCACAARDASHAKIFFPRIPPAAQASIIQRCQDVAIDLRPE